MAAINQTKILDQWVSLDNGNPTEITLTKDSVEKHQLKVKTKFLERTFDVQHSVDSPKMKGILNELMLINRSQESFQKFMDNGFKDCLAVIVAYDPSPESIFASKASSSASNIPHAESESDVMPSLIPTSLHSVPHMHRNVEQINVKALMNTFDRFLPDYLVTAKKIEIMRMNAGSMENFLAQLVPIKQAIADLKASIEVGSEEINHE